MDKSVDTFEQNKRFLSTSFRKWNENEMKINRLFHCHYFPYLVLVFVFKFDCSLGNLYFWRCMLEHTKHQVHKCKTTCVQSWTLVVTHLFRISNFICSRTHPPFVVFRTRTIDCFCCLLLFSRPILLNLTRDAWRLLDISDLVAPVRAFPSLPPPCPMCRYGPDSTTQVFLICGKFGLCVGWELHTFCEKVSFLASL